MKKSEYDFLAWTSFPSSIKLINDETGWVYVKAGEATIDPDTSITVIYDVKQQEVLTDNSRLLIKGLVKGEWVTVDADVIPLGTFDWITRTEVVEKSLREKIGDPTLLLFQLAGGKGTTWFDDLKLYQSPLGEPWQNGQLIYSNDFANWNPYIGAGALGVASGIGAHQLTKDIPTAIGAGVVGSLVGAAIGYLVPV
ncbi:MAG: hypothetical protein ACTSSA_11525 [Candidatus Freyarchaeota archaeon]